MRNKYSTLKYSVLLVDDIKENLDILNEILKDEYKIKAATNGETALRIAEQFKPDIILLDIIMPGMDGYEVCQRLKENPITRKIPVIFVTAKDEDVDEARGFELGAADYISKPIRSLIVKSRVRTQLALSHQMYELSKQVNKRTLELKKTQVEVIKILGRASEFKDNETGMHVVRVGEYSYTIAKAMGLDQEISEIIRDASKLHDVGKLGIPDSILKKPGRLEPEEYELIKRHSEIGANIIKNQDSELLKVAKIIALQHHERVDGAGYPNKLKGSEISLYAKIVALTDVFDALTSKRPYKEAWEFDRAVDYIRMERNKQFDKTVVDAFIKSLEQIRMIHDRFRE
ncbi:MAG TPA: response regulator [Thermotogota bacterium]|nr:response regulator [Thermotogota bacterium]